MNMGNLLDSFGRSNSKISYDAFPFNSNSFYSSSPKRVDFQSDCEFYILVLRKFGRDNYCHFPDDIVRHIMSFVMLRQSFTYSYDFDENGILYYLGTSQLKMPYVHPETLNLVKIQPQKFYCGTPQQAFSHNKPTEQNWLEKPVPNSYMEIEFLEHSVMPTAYTIRHGYPLKGHAIRNWRFEAKKSQDDLDWIILNHHKNDTKLQGLDMSDTATFFIPDHLGVYFKIFRIYQDGLTESNSCYLMISGFEIYGHLLYDHKHHIAF